LFLHLICYFGAVYRVSKSLQRVMELLNLGAQPDHSGCDRDQLLPGLCHACFRYLQLMGKLCVMLAIVMLQYLHVGTEHLQIYIAYATHHYPGT
jgi:hypothetical protein